MPHRVRVSGRPSCGWDRGPMPESFERILVVRQHDQLGDMLLAVPLLRALSARYPRASISLVAGPRQRDIVQGLEFVTEVIDFDKRRFLARGGTRPDRLI